MNRVRIIDTDLAKYQSIFFIHGIPVDLSILRLGDGRLSVRVKEDKQYLMASARLYNGTQVYFGNDIIQRLWFSIFGYKNDVPNSWSVLSFNKEIMDETVFYNRSHNLSDYIISFKFSNMLGLLHEVKFPLNGEYSYYASNDSITLYMTHPYTKQEKEELMKILKGNIYREEYCLSIELFYKYSD